MSWKKNPSFSNLLVKCWSQDFLIDELLFYVTFLPVYPLVCYYEIYLKRDKFLKTEQKKHSIKLSFLQIPEKIWLFF